MYKTPFDRIKCIIDGYLASTESHIHNLVLIVNSDLHLVNNGKSVHANGKLDFLFNLSSDPHRAYQIIRKIRSILERWQEVQLLRNENKEFYFELIKDGMVYYFPNDIGALSYSERLITEVSNLIEDDSQFSEFNIF